GTRESGALSMFKNYWEEPEILLRIPGYAFDPPAKVESSLVHLAIRPESAVAVAPAPLYRVTRCAFAMRRKMLRSSLRSQWPEPVIREAFEPSGISGTARPENLNPQEFARLASALPQRVGPASKV